MKFLFLRAFATQGQTQLFETKAQWIDQSKRSKGLWQSKALVRERSAEDTFTERKRFTWVKLCFGNFYIKRLIETS